MAMTAYGVNASEARKAWSRILAEEALKSTTIQKFIGQDDSAMIQEHTDLKKDMGDRVRVILRMLLTGDGVQGDDTLEGNEEALTTYTDDVLIDQLRHAARSKGKMSEQRVPFNVRLQNMNALRDWIADRMDRSFFTQVCGYTGPEVSEFGMKYDGTKTIFTGNNAALAPSSGAHFWSEAGTSADEGLDSTGDNMALSLIDDLVAQAKLKSPQIRPIKVNGEDVYVLFLHPRQVRDLRKDAASSGNWIDIQKAAMQGGDVSKNPIFTGALGMYNGVVLHESSRVCAGVNSSTGAAITTVRRAVFCGAQAAGIAFGQGHSFENFDWYEELFDYGNQLGVKAGCIFGLKKLRYNSSDFGTMVLSTYAGA